MDLKVQVHARIKKPVKEVFDAVVNPKKVESYFATGGVSGPMEEGLPVSWKFEGISFVQKMKVIKLVQNSEIHLDWFNEDGNISKVQILFEKLSENETMVTIKHSGYKENERGLEDSYSHCEGWTVMLSSLKGFLEFGVNIARGYW